MYKIIYRTDRLSTCYCEWNVLSAKIKELEGKGCIIVSVKKVYGIAIV